MNKINTMPIVPRGRVSLTVVVVTLMLGMSGYTQASRWMARNHASLEAAATVAVDNEDWDLPPTQSLSEATSERSKFILTGFTEANESTEPTTETVESNTFAEQQTETAHALVPPALPKMTPKSSAETAAAMSQHQHQFTKLATPRPTLVTLGATESLQEKLKDAPGVVLVDFYADWCGPCRRQGTILHGAEFKAKQNNATIIKVNVDRHRQIATQYQVSGLPTLVAIKNGKVVKRQVGLANSAKVESLLRM